MGKVLMKWIGKLGKNRICYFDNDAPDCRILEYRLEEIVLTKAVWADDPIVLLHIHNPYEILKYILIVIIRIMLS